VKRAVTGTSPGGPYSPGIIAQGTFLYVSGQTPQRDGNVVLGTIEEETRLTLDNIGRVLESAGAAFADVVRCGVFLTDLGNFGAMNAVYETYFPEPRPARTTVGVALLHGMKIEIDCVVALPG
jgi:2-iminobutanoate/2-iminopropanoate deaminase